MLVQCGDDVTSVNRPNETAVLPMQKQRQEYPDSFILSKVFDVHKNNGGYFIYTY